MIAKFFSYTLVIAQLVSTCITADKMATLWMTPKFTQGN